LISADQVDLTLPPVGLIDDLLSRQFALGLVPLDARALQVEFPRLPVER
jgi:hypothetical protein